MEVPRPYRDPLEEVDGPLETAAPEWHRVFRRAGLVVWLSWAVVAALAFYNGWTSGVQWGLLMLAAGGASVAAAMLVGMSGTGSAPAHTYRNPGLQRMYERVEKDIRESNGRSWALYSAGPVLLLAGIPSLALGAALLLLLP